MAHKKEPLKHQAYDFIKANIISCTYAPGTLINEELIREQIDASRTPIRDALSRLEQEGLVKILPKKGVLVTDITLKDLNALYETRFLLEPYAVLHYGGRIPQEAYASLYQKYCAFLKDPDMPYSYDEMDEQFHMMFLKATENPYFLNMYSAIGSQISRTRTITGNTSQGRLIETVKEHSAVLEAALKNDWKDASEALLYHLKQSKNSYFSYLLKRELI